MSNTLRGQPARFAGGLHPVGDGCFAWLAPNGEWGAANAGLIVGDGASLLVDTLWDRRLARGMLTAMAPPTEAAPIATVVNTHSDGDHWWGNAEVPADAEIVTSEASLAVMRHEPGPDELHRMKRLSGVARRLPGLKGMGEYVGDMLAPFDFAGLETRLPDRSFSGRCGEDVGGRSVTLIEVGPAHTAGDLVVHVPDARVVFAADILFVDSTPVTWAGPVENWIAALDTLLDLDADTFVPGHGPVTDRAGVETLRDYWEWLLGRVAEHHDAGRSALEATRAILDEPDFAPYRSWECPERTLISVEVVHRARSGGGPLGTDPRTRTKLFRQVATLV